jgi:ABC-type sugar transport system ATPase subunit
VYQDLVVAPELDPAANLFLGREPHRRGILGQARHAGRPGATPARSQVDLVGVDASPNDVEGLKKGEYHA